MSNVRKINGISITNTSITGFTYSSSSNTLTIGDSNNSNFSTTIQSMSGLTVTGILSANTVYIPSLAAPAGNTISLGIDSTGLVTTGSSVVAASAENVRIPVRNQSGVTILEGKAVYVSGASSGLATIALALADSNVNTTMALGLVENDILNGGTGYVIAFGNINNLNTSSFLNGDKVYVSDTTAGSLTTTPPVSPNNVMFIGTVTNANPVTGKILIDTLYTFKLSGLSDVAISSLTEGQILRYDATNQLWRNQPLPNDSFITGGTFSSSTSSSGGTITFGNSTGGTIIVSGLARPMRYYTEFSGAPATPPTATGINTLAMGNSARASSNYSIALGESAGSGPTNSQDIINIGRNSGNAGTGGNGNSVMVGLFAGYNVANSNNAIDIGENAGLGHANSINSIMLGSHAGNSNNYTGISFTSRASYSTYIGYNAGRVNTTNFSGFNNIVIGTNVGVPSGSSNTLNIGGVIWADGLYSTTTGYTSLNTQSNGRVGINSLPQPNYALYVNGNILGAYIYAQSYVVCPNIGIDTQSFMTYGTGIRTNRNTGTFFHVTGSVSGFSNNVPFVPISGNGSYILTDISPTINQQGGASGITRGVYINPILTSAYDWRAIEVVTGRTILDTLSARSITAITISAATYLNLPPFAAAFSGGTVTGATYFQNGLSANTISATTYLGLPIDVYVTGGTFSSSSSTIIFTNITGGTFNVTGISTSSPFTGGTVSGATIFTGGLSANTFSASSITGRSGTFNTLSSTTISATTYLNLPPTSLSATLTGGTMSGNTLILTNSSGQSVNVNGIVNTATTLTINGVDFDLNASREWLTSQASTGILNYNTGITTATSVSINISSMSGYVVNNESDPFNPTFSLVTYSGNTSVPVTTINTGIGSYVFLNSAGVPFFQNTFPTSQERKQNIWLGKVGHPLSAITFVINEPDFITSPVSQLRDLFQAVNYINGGVYPYANGANLNFNLTSGFVTGKGLNLHNSKLNPDRIQVGPSVPTSFLYRTQTGGTFVSTTLISGGTSDVNGTATAIGGLGTQATNQWIFVVPGAGIAVQFGQTIYTTLTDAIAAVGRENFVVFPNLVDNALLIGVLSVTKGATDLTNTAQARFFRADKFGQIIGAQAGVSTTNLQNAYDNSVQPQITTTSTGGALQLKGFTSSSGTSLFQGLNSAGTPTFVVTEGGGIVIGGSGFSNSNYQLEICGQTKTNKIFAVYDTPFAQAHDGAIIIRNPNGSDIAMGVSTDGILRIKTASSGIDILNGTTEMILGGSSRAMVGSFNTPLYFYSNQIERAFIDAAGKFTVGTANPGSTTRFEVSGNTRLMGISSATTLDVTGNTRFIGASGLTGSTVLISSNTQNTLTVIGSGNSNTSPIFSVQGSQGELFSVSDSLIGSLFSVNDISGLPVLEVFSDDTILMGNYLAPSLNTTIKILTSAGTNVLYAIPTSAYTGAFVDYTVNNGLNLRAGNLMAVWTTATTQYTESSTNDIGNTSGITFSMAISGSNAVLRASGVTSGWTVKSIIRSI